MPPEDSPPTASELIDKWPKLSDFAQDAGVEYGTAKAMRRRSSIAPEHWPNIIAGAAARGIDVTYEQLASARKAAAKPSEPCAS